MIARDIYGSVGLWEELCSFNNLSDCNILEVGDTIHIKGHTSDFTQLVDSMQIDRDPVDSAGAGDHIGITVKEHARPGDTVFRVS